jgi:hypothetical protein
MLEWGTPTSPRPGRGAARCGSKEMICFLASTSSFSLAGASSGLTQIAVVGLCLAAWIFHAALLERRRKRTRLANLRAGWGRAGDGRDLGTARTYDSALSRAGEHPKGVDTATWRDLNGDAVFAQVDRCATFAGRARLYHRLRTPHGRSAADLSDFDRAVTAFAEHTAMREQVQLVLGEDGRWPAAIVEVLFGEIAPAPALRIAFPLLGIATAISLLLVSVSIPARIAFFGLAATSLLIRLTYARRTLASIDGFRAADELLATASRVLAVDLPALGPESQGLRAAMERLGGLRKMTSWLVLDSLRTSELSAVFVTYLNALFLLDVTAFAFGAAFVRANQGAIREVFNRLGDLDAALSVASFRAGSGRFTRPVIDSAKDSLLITGAVHPLLRDPVPNSLHLGAAGLLVTGANMSGKSTLVRTVAVNALLAQTIFTVLASAYEGPPLYIRTLMAASDDIERNKSYYLAELEGARALLEPCPPGIRGLIVVDELFRGTNTGDRIAAGSALLRALHDAGHFVMASTHDLELVELLRDHFRSCHLAEELRDGQVVFHYELRDGTSRNRNAIALLAKCGFPPEVVANAIRAADAVDRSRSHVTTSDDEPLP